MRNDVVTKITWKANGLIARHGLTLDSTDVEGLDRTEAMIHTLSHHGLIDKLTAARWVLDHLKQRSQRLKAA